ncbi:MAG: type II toxin-antitoxin system VapB family antitoxin [Geminicoccaceae bacterium]
MGFYVRSDRVRELARRIADRRGCTMTEVLEHALEREEAADNARIVEKLAAVRRIQERVAQSRDLRPGLTDSDLYDDQGNPIL